MQCYAVVVGWFRYVTRNGVCCSGRRWQCGVSSACSVFAVCRHVLMPLFDAKDGQKCQLQRRTRLYTILGASLMTATREITMPPLPNHLVYLDLVVESRGIPWSDEHAIFSSSPDIRPRAELPCCYSTLIAYSDVRTAQSLHTRDLY